jgi:hypothetical protein
MFNGDLGHFPGSSTFKPQAPTDSLSILDIAKANSDQHTGEREHAPDNSMMLQRWRGICVRNARSYQFNLIASGARRCFADQRGSDMDEAELKAARAWLAKLDAETIPREICDISFSRSSGPGGQNVNK